MENAGWLKIDRYLDEANVADYDACIFPGGCWNPDFLRVDKHAQAFCARHATMPANRPAPSATGHG